MSNEKTINFTFNFNAPVGQNIAHVNKLEAHFDKDMTMQVVDTKGLVGENSPKMEENSEEGSSLNVPESVKGCFQFTSDFVRQHVEGIVQEFYLGSPSCLAMIEVVLFDHGQLKKRNSHKAFVHALVDWKILPTDIDFEKTINGMASKLRSPFPKEGYKNWSNIYLNEKNLCINIGKKLPESMKYNRNE